MALISEFKMCIIGTKTQYVVSESKNVLYNKSAIPKMVRLWLQHLNLEITEHTMMFNMHTLKSQQAYMHKKNWSGLNMSWS